MLRWCNQMRHVVCQPLRLFTGSDVTPLLDLTRFTHNGSRMKFSWLVWTGSDTESWVSSGVEQLNKAWSSGDTCVSLEVSVRRYLNGQVVIVLGGGALNSKKWAWQLLVGVWVCHYEALRTLLKCWKSSVGCPVSCWLIQKLSGQQAC